MQFKDKGSKKRLSLQKLLAYGGEMQHSNSENNVYDSQTGLQQMSPNAPQNLQSNYLSSSHNVRFLPFLSDFSHRFKIPALF